MTPEEQEIADALKAAQDANGEEAKAEPSTETDSSSTEETVDYEALIKVEKDRVEAAEKAAAEYAFKAREAKRTGATDDEEKPLTRSEAMEIVQSAQFANQKALNEAKALSIARANTSSESEAQAALLFWKNRVTPSDNLEEDVKFAIGGLNAKKVVARNAELARALRSKDGVSDDVTSAQREGLTGPQKIASNSPLAGYIQDKKTGIYSKKLASGRTHYVIQNPRPGQKRSWTD